VVPYCHPHHTRMQHHLPTDIRWQRDQLRCPFHQHLHQGEVSFLGGCMESREALLHTVNNASDTRCRETTSPHIQPTQRRPITHTNWSRSSSAAGFTPSSKRRVMPAMSLPIAIAHIDRRRLIFVEFCTHRFITTRNQSERAPSTPFFDPIVFQILLSKAFRG
jgi:hypothetical protein